MASAKGARTAAIWGTGLLEANQPKVLGELSQGYDASRGLIGQGRDAALGYLGQAGDLYGDLRNAGSAAVGRYEALAGGKGSQAALDAIYSSPEYLGATAQGNLALNRRRAAGGMLNSGNADADAITLGQQLAMQYLGNARQAQLPLMSMYSQGVQGGAGTFGNMANTATGTYGAEAGVATDYYGNRASVLDDTTKNIVGLGVSALKAGDAAKSANQAMMMQGVTAGLGLLGGAMGVPGGFTNIGKVASPRMSSGTGGLY